MISSAALLHTVVRHIREHGGSQVTLPDLAALALVAKQADEISVDEIPGALSLLGLSIEPLVDVPARAFTERGRLRVLRGRICPLVSVEPAELLAPLLRRLKVPSEKPVPRPPPPRPPPPRPIPPRPRAATPPKKALPPPAVAKPPPAPAVPAPPARGPATVLREPVSLDALMSLLTQPSTPPDAFSLCVDAHLLGMAERFEELLAPGQMSGVEPHTYQIETVRRVLRHFRGRTLLADEVGLGKTVEAMMVLREYQLRGMVKRALVLVPPALLGQWQGELVSKAGIEPHVATDVDEAFWQREGVVLASLALARLPRHAPAVTAVPWDLVIVDEAHHLKNRATQAFKLVDALKSRFLLLLTATPVENDLVELYNLVTLLKPGQLSTLADFKKRFADPKDPTAARDVPRLRALLGEVMVRNTRASSGLSLPPRYVTTIATEPTDQEAALYDAVVALFRQHRSTPGARRMADTLMLEAGSSTAAVSASLARFDTDNLALAAGLASLRAMARPVTSSAKGNALLDLFTAHALAAKAPQQEKMLVFTRFRETLSEVERIAREAGVEVAVVHGGMERTRKDAAFARFREDVPLLLCTDVGSEGQNLQFCHLLVNYDLPWNPMIIEQRIGRIHRYGQTEPVRVYNLAARGTAEERLLDVLDRRVHLFELVVGEMDMVLGNMVEQADLEERVLSIYASSNSEAEIETAFDAIADELALARGQAARIQKLDEALFGREMET
jgi:superfamily II DNA or RNA helicase